MLKELKNIIKDLAFNNVKEELDKIEKKLNNKNLNVVLVGEFNAGKSSLINKYYGISLPVKSEPETATIWKIIIGDEDKIIVKFKDDSEKIVENEKQVKELNQEEISVVEYYIKSENNKGLILVDTPGLSSLDDFHKKALEHYIEEADVVLVLADITQGLVDTTMSFLNENIENSQKLYMILTKGDLSSEQNKSKQITYIKENFKFLKDVVVVSKDDISSLEIILNDILKEKEQILKERTNTKLHKICKFTTELIKEQIQLEQNASSDELKAKIKEIRNTILDIEDAIRKKQVEFNNKLQQIIQESQNEFEKNLKAKVDWIVDALYDNNLEESIDDRFQIAIQDSLNSVLTQIENKINKELNDMFNNLYIPNTNLSGNWVVNISDNVVIAREFLVNFIENISKIWPPIYIIVKNLKNVIRVLIDLVAETATRNFVSNKVSAIIPEIANEVNSTLYNHIQNISDELFKESIKDLVKQKEDYIAMIEDIYKKIDESKEKKEKEINTLKEKLESLERLCGGEE